MRKEYHSLSFPTTLFIDCVGSYFYSVFNYLADQDSKDDLLYFLHSCKLKYEVLDRKVINDKYSNNPWGYQPVKLYTETNGELFNMDTYHGFCEFLRESFNISVENAGASSAEILPGIIDDIQNDKLIIVFIDERYIPYSQKYYNKQSNYHGLLIKAVDFEQQLFTVIDTELSGDQTVPFHNMEEAIRNCGTGYVSVCGKEFINRFPKKQVGSLQVDKEIFNGLMQDISLNLAEATEDLKGYFYKGYYFSTLFKILPYIKMRHHYLSKAGASASPILVQSQKLVDLWRNLTLIMLKQIGSSDYSEAIILQCLKQLQEEEMLLAAQCEQ